MRKLVLLVGGLALGAWAGPALLVPQWNGLAVGLFVLAAGLGAIVFGLMLFWANPFGPARTPLYEPPGAPDEGPLQVPVLCYRPNGEAEWLLGELLPIPAR